MQCVFFELEWLLPCKHAAVLRILLITKHFQKVTHYELDRNLKASNKTFGDQEMERSDSLVCSQFHITEFHLKI